MPAIAVNKMPAGSELGTRIELKPKALRVVAPALGVAIALIVAPITSSDDSSIFEIIVRCGIVLASWFVLFRAARSRVVADSDGVFVRNPFTTHHFEWEEVDEFRARGGFLGFRAFGSPATMWLADGRKKYLIAVQPSLLIEWDGRSSNRRACEELNELRRQST